MCVHSCLGACVRCDCGKSRNREKGTPSITKAEALAVPRGAYYFAHSVWAMCSTQQPCSAADTFKT